jgi:dihydroxyacetone kinase
MRSATPSKVAGLPSKTFPADKRPGLAYLNPNVALDSENKVVYSRKISSSHVAVISGGGSGHEPSHAAMVGQGLLTAAVCGPPFASPNSSQITSALKRTADAKGTLLVVYARCDIACVISHASQ